MGEFNSTFRNNAQRDQSVQRSSQTFGRLFRVVRGGVVHNQNFPFDAFCQLRGEMLDGQPAKSQWNCGNE
jgi:hypothetical protein